MTSDDLADFWLHTITVETYLGTSGGGTVLYSRPRPVKGFLSKKQRFTRNLDGEQVPSQATFSADVSLANVLVPKSRVTVPGEQPTTVISRSVPQAAGFIDAVDRVKVYLQ